MNFLNLPSWVILGCVDSEDDYQISARSATSLTVCPYCESTGVRKHGTDAQVIRGVPLHRKRVAICVNRQRFRCTNMICGKTFFDLLPDVPETRFMTKQIIPYEVPKKLAPRRE